MNTDIPIDTDSAHLDEHVIAGTEPKIVKLYRDLAELASNLEVGLFEDEVVILDTETTGLDPKRCELIEMAAIRVRGNAIIDSLETLVNPNTRIPQEITELTGIRSEDLIGAPAPKEAVKMLADFAGSSTLVAHNASFDQSFIMPHAKAGTLTGEWVDTFALAQIVLPRLKTHRLADLARAFGCHIPSHRAMDDIIALAGVWRVLLAALHSMHPGVAAYISGLSPQTHWPLRDYFSQAAQAMPGIDFSLRQVRSQQAKQEDHTPRRDADDVLLKFPDEAHIENAFSAEGIAGLMYPDYEERAEQTAMAKDVVHCFSSERIGVLEAGTGVGKSMAYLLPCSHIARENKITVGVATKTNALMDQLVYHELPRLKDALGKLEYVALKGYEHYPCMRKIERMARNSEKDSVAVIQMIATLLNYIAQTSWGDLDALNIHWYGLPRSEVQASPHDCLKRRCPFFPFRCYLHGARRRAASADIVVTNHALLFRDMQADNGILPPIRHWIIDEAHSVESEARRQLSHSISARDLEHALARLSNQKSGLTAQVRKKAPLLEGGDMLYGATIDIDNRVDATREQAEAFFMQVKELGADSQDADSPYVQASVWIDASLREKHEWVALESMGALLADSLFGLVGRMADLVSMLEQFEGALASQLADLSGVASDLRGARDALTLVMGGVDTSFVYAAQVNRSPNRLVETLEASKLNIGDVLSELFYPQMKSVVFTSATLATAEKEPYAHFLRASGLDQLPVDRVFTDVLASSYKFDEHMTVFVADDMPEPTAPAYQDDFLHLLYEVHTAMGGSVLTLFTNRREMEAAYRKLKPLLATQGLGLIAQTKGSNTKTLRDRFLADESLSLFALRSFWEGFDAPGDTLRCVVIARLPFGRPNDPISREREARERHVAWRKYTLPEAVMDLKQAAGRLIRNSTDTGWMVIADSRSITKSYGKSFLRAMPTHDIRVCGTDEIARTMRYGAPGVD